MDRGPDFHLYYKIYTSFLSGKRIFKGEVNKYKNKPHCATKDGKDLRQGVSVPGAAVVRRGRPGLRRCNCRQGGV